MLVKTYYILKLYQTFKNTSHVKGGHKGSLNSGGALKNNNLDVIIVIFIGTILLNLCLYT